MEYQLDETSYVLYNQYIKELTIKLRYNAVTHLYGNSNYSIEDINENIESNNPFNVKIGKENTENSHKNTIDELKIMGINVNINKGSNFTPISQMFKNQTEKISDKRNNK